MIEVKFHESAQQPIKFAVIAARYQHQWIFCKHKERTTLEMPGGHIEEGEKALEAAKRELKEETSALRFEIEPVSVYSVREKASVNENGEESFGMLFYAEVYELEKELHYEIESIHLMNELPSCMTYPEIQPKLMAHVIHKKFFDETKLSTLYKVRKITEEDVKEVYELCKDHPLYYDYCPPFVTEEALLEDLKALPPNKTYQDKYYVGFYHKEQLIALMDLILEYPNSETAFIGFFMIKHTMQGKGIGTKIIAEVLHCLDKSMFAYVRLGYVKGNPQSKAFWEKNGFKPTGVEAENEVYTVVVMQRECR